MEKGSFAGDSAMVLTLFKTIHAGTYAKGPWQQRRVHRSQAHGTLLLLA